MGAHAHHLGLLHAALGDRKEAERAATEALRDAPAAGCPRLGGGDRQRRSPSLATGGVALRRAGDVWEVGYRGRSASVRHTKGVQDLAVLRGPARRRRTRAGADDRRPTPVDAGRPDDRCSTGPHWRRTGAGSTSSTTSVDAARAERRRPGGARVDRARAGARRAAPRHPPGRAVAQGWDNRDAERARKAVSARIRDAIERIEAVLPELGRHLDRSVTHRARRAATSRAPDVSPTASVDCGWPVDRDGGAHQRPRLDTVAVATEDPHREQPWADLGLKADEYQRIREILGRRPTSSELAMYSVMWSEHCSYKSSKVHLKQFSEIPQETPVGKMLAGIGENAGVIDIGQGYAVTFKVESHNHPSYVEPYQGAATGIGGIVRDILAMGARPVAVMDPLRFGPLDADDTHRVLPGIVAGIGGYGNCLGLPNIGGETVFDPTYLGNPLVNALCVGVLRHEDLHLAKASGVGNQVILYGATTGGDGIGGVSVLASETFDEERPGQAAQRPGRRPVHGEAAHRVHPRDLRRRPGRRHPGPRRRRPVLRDLRAGVRRRRRHARRARPGPAARLDARARGDPDERVAGADDGGRRARRRRGVPRDLREVGRRRDRDRRGHRHRPAADRLARRAGRRRAARSRGARRADVPAPLRPPRLAGRPPGRRRRGAAAAGDRRGAARDAAAAGRGSPNLCDKSWITDQYDRYVRGNTVLAQPSDSGMIRVDEETDLGVAVSTDCNGRFAKLDPYAGAQLALVESYRNVATGGARPLAVSDCLNFGSPEDPSVMWQFAEACRGLKDACASSASRSPAATCSLYNQTGETAILPTPVVAVLGVIDDVTRRTPSALRRRRRAGLPARRDPRGAVRLGVGARRARPPRRAAAGGRPGRGAGAGRAARTTRSAW